MVYFRSIDSTIDFTFLHKEFNDCKVGEKNKTNVPQEYRQRLYMIILKISAPYRSVCPLCIGYHRSEKAVIFVFGGLASFAKHSGL